MDLPGTEHGFLAAGIVCLLLLSSNTRGVTRSQCNFLSLRVNLPAKVGCLLSAVVTCESAGTPSVRPKNEKIKSTTCN